MAKKIYKDPLDNQDSCSALQWSGPLDGKTSIAHWR
jgi:hypothetical protein